MDEMEIKPAELERKVGISNGYLSKMYKRLSDIGEGVLIQLIENCPDINPMWLVLGTGEMLKSDAPAPIQTVDVTVDKLIKEVKELSAENAVLKLENEKLKKDIKNKSNPHPNPSVVSDS